MKRTFQENDCVGNIPNAEIFWQMREYAISKGVTVDSGTTKESFNTYKNIVFIERLHGAIKILDYYNQITHEKFYEYCDNWAECQPKKVQLNIEYSAVIDHSTSTVKVGCQFFTFEKITELYNAIQSK